MLDNYIQINNNPKERHSSINTFYIKISLYIAVSVILLLCGMDLLKHILNKPSETTNQYGLVKDY